MLAITFQAVAKVIVTVMVGAVCCSSIPNSETTMRDFSFLISNVLLPALTITNTARSVNVDMLVRCTVLLIFSVLVVFLGIGCAIIMAHLLFGVRKEATGIPVELCKDVRLDLLLDDSHEETKARQGAAAGAKKRTQKKKKSGIPYAAVVLSKRLRELGIDGHDIVAALEAPSVEVQEFPFYYWGAWVACSIQNTVTLPLSVLQNLSESLPWLSFSEGTAYIFVFSITATLYMWMAGPVYVEKAQKESIKRRLIREIILKHKRMTGQCDAMTQTEISYTIAHDPLRGGATRDADDAVLRSPPMAGRSLAAASRQVRAGVKEGGDGDDRRADSGASPLARETVVHVAGTEVHTAAASRSTSPPPERMHADTGEQTDFQVWSPNTARHFRFPEYSCAEQFPYDWEQAGYIRVRYADELKDPDGPSALSRAAHATKQLCLRLLQNIPFMSIVLGIFIGIIPPLRNLFFDGGPLEMITDALTLVGQGNIPAALLLLGANLVGSTAHSHTEHVNVRLRDSEQNTDFPLVPASDTDLLGEEGRYAEWYRQQHEAIMFDEHASFTLQTVLRQQAAERIATARLSTATAGDGDSGGASGDSATAAATPSAAAGGKGRGKKAAMVTAEDLAAAGPPDQETEGAEAQQGGSLLTEVRRALSLEGVKKKFVWGVIFERLIATPAIGFIILTSLIKGVPFIFGGVGNMDRTLLVVLFMELAAPTAINSSLLFNQRQYMTYHWAKMLFFQYLTSTLTLVMWASIGLVIVQNYT